MLLPQADLSLILFYALTTAVIVYMVYVAITDFVQLKISNRSVFVGAILYIGWAAAAGAASPWTDMMAGGILLALGFAFWMFRLAGAGDAKFMLVCGALVGFDHLMYFAVFLAIMSIGLYVMIKVASRPIFYPLVTITKIGEFLESGKVPYGVPLASAALAAFLMRTTEYILSM